MEGSRKDRVGDWRRQPMVAAAVVFVAGVVIGVYWPVGMPWVLSAMGAAFAGWIIAEWRGWARWANVCLIIAILIGGIGVWQMNQRQVEARHIARFLFEREEVPIVAHIRVIDPPEAESGQHGNLYWVGEMEGVQGERGWVDCTGTVTVKWSGGADGTAIRRGDLVEVYGWARWPAGRMNPGAMDMREMLARDRVFVEVHVPRASGLMQVQEGPGGHSWLVTLRTFLRGKLLEHLARIDVISANTLVALLLGVRDPSVNDVTRAFADAGVAHLLAISGSHLVFFTAFVWFLLRMIPMRPRLRELAVAFVVMGYVLATPCGPPVIRAAIVVLMVMITRLMGRPRTLLNTLCVAMIAVILWRPADVISAGFQLTFACTFALVVFGERVHQALFGAWLEKQTAIVGLAGTKWARRKLWVMRVLCGLLAGNLIGVAVSMPLLIWHFGQVAPIALLAGIVALPFVMAAMVAALVQLLAALFLVSWAAWLAAATAFFGKAMVWFVTLLAGVPGAVFSLRSPPAWVIAVLFIPFVLWALRRMLHVRRAVVINVFLAVWTLAIGWWMWTQPVNKMRLEILCAGQGSSIIMRTAGGEVWVIDAGSRDIAGLVDRAIAPAMRREGVRRADALVLSRFDAVHGQMAGEVIDRFTPSEVIAPGVEWSHAQWTFAGALADREADSAGARRIGLHAGQMLTDRAAATRVIALWPPVDWPADKPASLVLACEYAGKRVLVADPNAALPVESLLARGINLHADALVFTAPQRGKVDPQTRKLIDAAGTQIIIWSGRSGFAPRKPAPGEWNTDDGALEISVERQGRLVVSAAR